GKKIGIHGLQRVRHPERMKTPIATIKHGSISIPISRRKGKDGKPGAYLFKRKVGSRGQNFESVDLDKVKDEAKTTAKLIADQRSQVLGLSQNEVAAFLKWRDEQFATKLTSLAFAEYRAAQDKKELSIRYKRAIYGLEKQLAPVWDKNIRWVETGEV